VIYAATNKLPDNSYDYVPVAFATTESNGYFVTSFLIFNNPDDIDNVKAGKAVISKDDMEKELDIKLAEKIEGSGENMVSLCCPID
jgi:hypothetical protein